MSGSEFIRTRGSEVKKKQPDNFLVVEYERHKKKPGNPKRPREEQTEEEEKVAEKGLSMKKTKYEIIKFGMTGFDKKKKEDAKVQLALRLGAKPKKNKYINYKELLQQKKEEKANAQSEMDFQQLGKNKVGRSNAKGKGFRRKEKAGILDVYGTVKAKAINKNKKK